MNPVYVRKVSLHLSRVLDDIGLNKVAIARRRRTYLYREKVRTIFDHLVGVDVSVYHFGSQTEGTTTPGLHSDIDTLYCLNDGNVIEDWSEWQQGKKNLLMLQENTAPGYCRLQLLRDDIPVAVEDLAGEHCTYNDRGRVLMTNTVINVHIPGVPNVRNGPARSESNTPWVMDIDVVFALPCRSWPAQAGEFLKRDRRYGWPTRRLLQEAVEHGVFIVPVGYRLSQTEPLEWRLSASLAERCLMFSLSIIHIKCYVILKMLVKTFVDPLMGKSISSYHCKTAVLYCTENNEAGFWREDNFIQCVQQCLVVLLTWVTVGYCPNFIMPEENLFAGKVTVQNRDLLRSIFINLIQSKGRALLRVRIDDLGHKLQTKFNTEPSSVPVIGSLATVRLVGGLEYRFQTSIHNDIKDLLWLHGNTKPVAAARFVQQKIVMLRYRLRHADKLERQAIQGYIEVLSCWLGSLLASIALSRKMRVPRAAIKLLRSRANSDVSSLLKLASVYHSSGDLCKVEKLLQRLEAHFCRNEIVPVCNCCYYEPNKMTRELSHTLFVLRCRKARAGLFAHCVMFSPQEIHCAPPAIRNELFRAVGDDVQDRNPKYDRWMGMAVVYCLPYRHYLQYLTYRQLGKRDLQTRAFHSLERFIKENRDFSHLETAWNLLGQCNEMEQRPVPAMACYTVSLAIRPRNNAANWHVATLCYKASLRQPGTC